MAEQATYQNALALKTMLLEYRLESVLGAGGFGLTYLAWDTHLEKNVAIKEYLPRELAVRALDGSVVPVNTQSEFNYKWGLDRFIQEARTLARFSHPNIVRVNRFFEANGTSYMVMDYEDGESVNQYLRHSPAPDEATLRKMLLPIMDGLIAVHRAGFLHRDIKPSNVFLRKDGPPLLIDFGSARLVSGVQSETLTSIVSPGYAPIEQYMSDGRQGPPTDIYALSGVVFRAVTGDNPPDAVSRMKADTAPAKLAAVRDRYDERFLRAIEWGLKLDDKLRPQSVEEWRDLFTGRRPMSAIDRSPAGASSKAAAAAPTQRPARVAERARRSSWAVRIAVIIALCGLAALVIRHRVVQRDAAQAQSAASIAQGAPPAGASQNFAAADSDRSGGITREEMGERLPRYAARFDEIDTNKDGVVSLRELERFLQSESAAVEERPAPAAVPPAPPETVTRQAVAVEPPPQAAEPPHAGPPPPADVPPMVAKDFMRADVNGDGYLTPAEVHARFPVIESKFAAADTDGDGRLSLAEVWQFRKKMLVERGMR